MKAYFFLPSSLAAGLVPAAIASLFPEISGRTFFLITIAWMFILVIGVGIAIEKERSKAQDKSR